MITCQCTKSMGTYGSTSEYLTPISSNKYESGVAPLDSLPADWWNWLWQNITRNNDYTATFLNSIFSEINSVLSAAGVTPSGANTDDLKVAIERMCAKVASGEVAGSVLSSELSGRLHVNPDGTADINGLGTPSSLNTTATNVVAAINEVLAMAEGKAPTYHKTDSNIYGVPHSECLVCDGCADACGATRGHVGLVSACYMTQPLMAWGNSSALYEAAPSFQYMLCHQWKCAGEGYICPDGAMARDLGHVSVMTGNGLSLDSGIISMAPNVRSVVFNNTTYTPDADGCINLGATGNSFPGYGTNAGCALGAASAGTSTLAARADHVHPISCCLCTGAAALSGMLCVSPQGGATVRGCLCNTVIFPLTITNLCTELRNYLGTTSGACICTFFNTRSATYCTMTFHFVQWVRGVGITAFIDANEARSAWCIYCGLCALTCACTGITQPYKRFIGSGMIIQDAGACSFESSRVLINMTPISGTQTCFCTIGCTGVQTYCAYCACTFCLRGWITGLYN